MERVVKLVKHPLISGSSIIFVGFFVANFINYLFNLSMGRLLSVSDYGILISLTSIAALFAILQISLGNIFTKFTAKYHAVNDEEGVNGVLAKGFNITLILGLVIFLLLLISTPLFASFLHLQDWKFLIVIFLTILVSIFSSLPTGILQGKMKFLLISLLTISTALIRIVLGIFLVLIGLKVWGGINALFVSVLIPFLLVMAIVYKGFRAPDKKVFDEGKFLKEFSSYSWKFFLATLGISIIQNGDIILVRHFFDPIISGQYAALSLMGKAIFYVTSPLYLVLFPIIANKKEKKENVFETLLFAILIVLFIGGFLSFIYFSFPKLVLAIFFPAKGYQILASYLGLYSLFILIFSLVFVMNNFLLSLGKTGIYKLNLITSLLMVILLSLFHSSLIEVIIILFFVSFLLLMLLFVYYTKNGRD